MAAPKEDSTVIPNTQKVCVVQFFGAGSELVTVEAIVGWRVTGGEATPITYEELIDGMWCLQDTTDPTRPVWIVPNDSEFSSIEDARKHLCGEREKDTLCDECAAAAEQAHT